MVVALVLTSRTSRALRSGSQRTIPPSARGHLWRGALAAAVRHAGERVPFGRPFGRFQAVQQQLALAAAEVTSAAAAADSAAHEVDAHRVLAAELAIAVAKARTSEAAGAVARIAHQVHGRSASPASTTCGG